MQHAAIGLIESNSIAKGVEFADCMVKTAEVTILVAKSICPGKYIVMIGGDVADVKAAMDGAADSASSRGFLVNKVVIPRPHQQVINSLL